MFVDPARRKRNCHYELQKEESWKQRRIRIEILAGDGDPDEFQKIVVAAANDFAMVMGYRDSEVIIDQLLDYLERLRTLDPTERYKHWN